MKRFEDYLERCMRAEWLNHSINYAALKKNLKACRKRRNEARNLIKQRKDGYVSGTEWSALFAATHIASDEYAQLHDNSYTLLNVEDALLKLAMTERDEFSQCLQREWTRAMQFYETEILVQLRELVHNSIEGDTDTAVEELLEATAFLVVNVITLRQALIRYDGYSRTYNNNMPLTEWHWQRSFMHSDNAETQHLVTPLPSVLHTLLHPEKSETPTLSPVFPGVLHWKEIRHLEATLLQRMQSAPQQAKDLQQQLQHLGDLLDRTESLVQKAASGHIVFQDRVLGVARQYFLFGLQSYGLSMEPKLLVLRGHNLKQEIRAVATWRKTRQREQQPAKKSMFHELEPSNVVPLVLNLISCFLFMMNNYIIEPSSAYYANALGSSDALSGIMIGGAPVFALMSAVVYSFWTNHSYKAPILFAGTLMVVGNLMYANAYSFTSMELCLMGRAVTGLGAPRVINRRYVADATPFSLRTVASASFAMATALGAALGPAFAIVLDLWEFEFSLPFLGQQYFNGMTGPGYFMSLCWFLNTIAILVFFQEPVRSGLDELKQREKANSAEKYDDDEDPERTVNSMPFGSLDDDDGDEEKSAAGSVANFYASKVAEPRFCSCCQHLTRAVVLCMSLIFMKRIALESIMGSTSIITKNRYAWSIANVGTLHLVNGIIIIPVSAMSGWLSTYYEDRYLAVWFLAITLLGMIFMVDITDFVDSTENDTYNEGHWLAVGPVKYITGNLIAFSGIEACESYVASLMSKVVPSALAVGTFNSGESSFFV